MVCSSYENFHKGQSTEGVTSVFIDLEATVGTYEFRSYDGEQ